MKNREQINNFSILLHDIRSVQNVASVFRLCEILGANEIILSGVTPGPLDRFGFTRNDFQKISLGAEKSIKWKRVEKVFDFIKNFDGTKIALEQNEKSLDYKNVEIDTSKKYLIIPGKEVTGLEKEILDMCEIVAEIPQYGQKESLNIFSALSISLYRFFDR